MRLYFKDINDLKSLMSYEQKIMAQQNYDYYFFKRFGNLEPISPINEQFVDDGEHFLRVIDLNDFD
jgi:hypothetical protein